MTHEERNDALKRNNKVAIQRYKFAIKCLKGEKRKIVDLGCGMGYGSHMLYLEGHNVLGIDNSEEAIGYARKNYERRKFGCEFFKGDLNIDSYINLNNNEVVVCIETLCHLKDPQKFINSLVVKDLIISAPIDPDPNDGYPWRLHNFSEEQFKGLFNDWVIIKEFRQRKYLTLYLRKI